VAGINLGTLFFDLFARTDKLDKAEKKVKRSTGRMRKSFARLGTAIAAALSFEVARRSQVIAENMLLLDIRLKAVSDTSQQFVRNQQQLLKIADKTGQAFSDIVVLFEKIKLGTKDLNASNDQVLLLTDALNKLGVIGGASSTALNNSLRQLSQSFAGGIVRAEEFNSVVENTPAIARAIADGMGMTNGELRKMVIEGRLLSEDVFNAILSQQDAINARFELIPRTSSMAWQAVQNQASQALKLIAAEMDSSAGISGAFDRLAEKIIPLTRNFLKGVNGVQFGFQVLFAKASAGFETFGIIINNFFANLKTGFQAIPLIVERGFEVAIRNIQQSINDLIDGLPDKVREFAGLELINVADNTAAIAAIEQEIIDLAATNGALSDEAFQTRLQQIIEERDAKIAAGEEELIADLARIQTLSDAQEQAKGEDLQTVDPGEVTGSAVLDEAAFQDLLAKFGDQTEQIMSAERKRQEEINKIVGIGAKERAVLEKRSAILLQRDMARLSMMRIASVQKTMDDVIQLIGEGNAKQSALGRVALGVAKGLAIANAVIAMQQNIAEASKIGFPANIPLIASAISQGIGIITTIKGVSTSPGRQRGGPAVGGFATPITEAGAPEVFENARGKFLIPPVGGGGTVSPLDGAGGMGGDLNVTLINNGEPLEISANMVSRDELEIILDKRQEDTINTIDTSLARGRGSTSDSLRRGFDTQRNIR